MSRVLKGLFFAVGAGLGMGAAVVMADRRKQQRPSLKSGPVSEDILSVEPLLDRMECVEAEMDRRAREQEAGADERFRQMRTDLETEFEKLVDRRVSERVSVFERTLLEQSISIRTLRETAEASDANMQRLIVAIERLCERTPPPAGASPVQPTFETQLERALENPQPQQEFRARVVKETEPETKRPRNPMARVFAALLSVGLSRYFIR